MKKFAVGIGVAGLVCGLTVGSVDAEQPSAACWGQASAVFAQTGEMGVHSANQATPRLGLRNLARVLADAGTLPDDSMAALGAWVAHELGLSVEACL